MVQLKASNQGEQTKACVRSASKTFQVHGFTLIMRKEIKPALAHPYYIFNIRKRKVRWLLKAWDDARHLQAILL